MPANVRYRSTYYNTTGTSTLNRIDVLDTEAVGAIVNFSSTRPMDEFEGLTQDLKPGIFPSSFKFGMYIRETPAILTGTSMGVNSDFITDIKGAAEGRFLVAHYINNVLDFIGPIIYDQCSYEDFGEPYLLNITALDGLSRLQTEDYVSQVGDLKYYSRTQKSFTYSSSPLTYDGPLVGASYTIIEHIVNNSPAPGGVGGGILYTATTTWAWREIYSVNSPGSGWVFQGNSRWAHEVSYTNEVETEFVDSRYHLTRDVDDEKHRTILEYFNRAMVETKMDGEYVSPTVMYDTSIEWYENDTGDKAADMCGQTKLHEDPFLGKSWWDGIIEICRLLNMRVYYSKGRYHFEQISYRDGATFKRFTYESDGTLVGSETASLDLNFNTLPVKPQTGGIYKFLAPLKSVEASIKLDNANLLDGVNWKDGEYGQRYVGRIKKVTTDQKMWVVLDVNVTSTFDPATLLLYPQSFINLICTHTINLKYAVRITNLNTSTTYYLTDNGIGAFRTTGSWETTETQFEPHGLPFGTEGYGRYNADNYGYTRHAELSVLAETLPGAPDDMFDIHITFQAVPEFQSPAGQVMWTTIHADKFWTISNAITNTMRFYSVASLADFTNWEEAGTDAELAYTCENDVANSLKVKIPLAWADTSQHEKSIEIYDGTDWKRSEFWSIGGVGDPVPIGELLVYEVMSLRTVPRNLYSGAFVSSLPSSENRFQRGTDYYLPLSCTRDTDYDLFQGEFLQIAKSVPPAVDVLDSPLAGGPIPGLTPFTPLDPIVPTLYFETNEAITAGATLTEVDIVNTLGASVSAGETVSIIHPTSGVSDNVVLTADINPTDTVMYFESNVMVNSYPDASYIVIKDGDTTIESGGNKYNYVNFLYNGSTHSVPVALLDITPYLSYSQNQLIVYAALFRNGTRMKGYTTPQTLPDVNAFWFDDATNSIVFSIEFEDEYLVLRLGG